MIQHGEKINGLAQCPALLNQDNQKGVFSPLPDGRMRQSYVVHQFDAHLQIV